MQGHSVLIVCHSFPPFPGIGGRRWAKFAKYLKKDGYSVSVLSSENVTARESFWKRDVEGLNVEYLPYRFPKVLSRSSLGFFDKIKYRLWRAALKILNPGNYYDRSFFWKTQIEERVRFYIRSKSINTVIVTGAPFLLTYYVMTLKLEFPEVKFYADFRDLWTSDTEVSAFSALSKKRIEIEKQKEKFVVQNADGLFTVAEEMAKYFRSLTPKNKVHVLINGFDPDDVSNVVAKPTHSGKLNIVFAGSLYHNLDKVLLSFFGAMERLRNSNSEIYQLLSVDFYGAFPNQYLKLLESRNLSDVVHVHGEYPLDQVYGKIAAADACLLILNDAYNFSLSTKFCEYLGFKKEIIVISGKGSTSEFVTDNKLGYWIDTQNAYESLLKCLTELKEKTHRVGDPQFDISKFSLPVITRELEAIINTDLQS